MPIKIIKSKMEDDFVCYCGNMASTAGFYPCDEKGNYMEPEEDWKGHYKCDDCNQIYLLADKNTCTFCGREDDCPTKTVAGYTILEICTDCEHELTSEKIND